MFIMDKYFIKQKYVSTTISLIISTHYQFFYQIHIVSCAVSTVETIYSHFTQLPQLKYIANSFPMPP